ncbi:MAG: hypothetical protein IJ468_15450 [Lachnospiraceae bacterium]|nr:hypothetical protein [Lachnospiraceae bacterium]
MIWKALKVDLARSLANRKTIAILVAIAAFCLASAWESLWAYEFQGSTAVLVIQFDVLAMDAFKTVMVLLLCGLYAGSFCRDDSSHYLRLILIRQNVRAYTCSRFLVNTIAVVAVSVASFYLFAGFLSGFMPISGDVGTRMNSVYYKAAALGHPLIYVGMMGLQFGMVAAACSSIGLVFSAYQTNYFVSIGLGGMSFFAAISFIPYGTPFDVLNLVSMFSTLPAGYETPQAVMFAWGMIYPAIVIIICAVCFYRRMEWRTCNGYI